MSMEDDDIIQLFFDRDEKAIAETSAKYGNYCSSIARNDCEANFSFWDENHVDSYEEYIFSASAEELADYEIGGEFWTCNNGPIKGNWQVTFSMSGNE